MDNINTADQRELPILENFKSVTDSKVIMKNYYVKRARHGLRILKSSA